MTVQLRKHSCSKSPKGYTPTLECYEIDGKRTEWELLTRFGEKPATLEARVYVDYCPWCGAKL